MSKIICDICGTTYQDTADRCPICGYSRDSGIVEEILAENGSFGSERKQKAIFDYDKVNPQEKQEADTLYLEDAPEEEEPRHNVLLVVLLVIIITLLLTAAGFLYFRFYLPNNRVETPATEPESTAYTETSQETTEPRIPCQSLVLTGGVTELTREGQRWLLHVTVMPQDTTDDLVFYSEDEGVVTVTQDGRLEAIGEGETYVHILCGEKELRCPVIVRFVEETVPVEQTLPQGTDPATEETGENAAALETPETQPTEAAADVVLKLKDKDRSSNKRGVSFTLELDCDLKPEDVTWLTLDSNVAIVKNGLVTTIGPGSTKIVAQYKGQQVECIIRCNF